MKAKYKHLAEKDRVFLRIMLEKGYPKSKIADILGVRRSTIYREIKRNSCIHWHSKKTYYESWFAHMKYIKRRKRPSKLEQNKDLRLYVHAKLKQGWSPWQVEGRLKRENSDNCIISHETVYRHIYSDYGIRNTINSRKEFGHWECDLMMFKRGIKANLITLRERQSRFMVAIKNLNKTASGIALALISTVKRLKPYIKSITFDQGSEFQKYSWIKDYLSTDIYFCQPASPYQKGAIENDNGVVRSELPRHANIDGIVQQSINKLIEEINGRPLKCLGYQTPQEKFYEFVTI